MGLGSLGDLLGIQGGAQASTNFWASTTFMMQAILFLFVIIAVVFVAYRTFFYNIGVRVWKVVGDSSFKVVDDKGRIKRRADGTEIFELLKQKICIPPPPNEYFSMGRKGKLHIELISYGSSKYDYIPVARQLNQSIKSMTLNPLPADTRNWAMVEIKRDAQKFTTKDFLDRYGPMIALGTIALMVIIVTWILMGTTKQAISASVELANAVRGISQGVAGIQAL